MSSGDDSSIDDDVRAAWRATGAERTPPSLDSKVLRQAAAAASGHWRLRPAWMQPIAFVVTLAIGAVVVFNVQAPLQGSGEQSAAPPRTHTDDSGRVADDDSRRQQAGTESQAGGLRDDDAVRRSFEESADDAARSLRGVAASDAASLAAGREVAEPARVTATEPGDDAGSACSNAERSAAETWWRCAQALLESGDEQAARRELDLLREFHPGFEPAQ